MIPIIRNFIKDSMQYALPGNSFIWRLPSESGSSACLTFDDGPDPEFTIPTLDLLDSYNMKATFFLIGEKVKLYPEITLAIISRGHHVSGHTYTHKEIVNMANQELKFELDQCRDILKEITGVHCNTFRPPRGTMNIKSLKTSISSGYNVIHWTKTYSDYLMDGSDQLIERMIQNPPQARDIILLHDNNPHTIVSLDFLINDMIKRKLRNAVINESGETIVR